VDFPVKSKLGGSPVTDQGSPELPTVVVTDDEPSGGSSAASPPQWPSAPRMSAQSSLQDDDSADGFSHRDRVNEFNRTRPAAGYQSRISSWSDAFSARDMLGRPLKPSRLGHSPLTMDEEALSSAYPSTTGTPEDELEPFNWRVFHDTRHRSGRPSSASHDVLLSLRTQTTQFLPRE
jgi:hypothetical protein